MKKIDSQMLESLNKALGLSGVGSPVTELTDGIVDQVVDVNPIVRRGRTQAQTGGIYTGVLRNIHTAANTITSSVNPYNVGAGVIAPWPDPMPPGFDIWAISASVLQISGTGTLACSLFVDYDRQQGWGQNNASAAVVSEERTPLAFWDALITLSGDQIGLLNGANGPHAKLSCRLPVSRTLELVFISTSSATATFECQIVLGVFPTALGQDAQI